MVRSWRWVEAFFVGLIWLAVVGELVGLASVEVDVEFVNEDVVFEFLLESFSMYCCGDGAFFLEGIEFQAIGRVKHEESKKLKEVQQVFKSNFNVDQVQPLPTKFEEIFKIHNNHDELFWLGEVNGKKFLVLSAKAALYKFSNVDLFTSIPSA
ncbi:hypothetical protein Tco_1379896 [Tanacetum coccineum]